MDGNGNDRRRWRPMVGTTGNGWPGARDNRTDGERCRGRTTVGAQTLRIDTTYGDPEPGGLRRRGGSN
jgi:hypothetical protein